MKIIGALLVLIYGLTQLVMGYVWFEDILQIPTIALWFLTGFLLAFRIIFPFSIGAYFAAIEVWNFEWWQAALFAFPGLAIAAATFLGVLADSVLNYKNWGIFDSSGKRTLEHANEPSEKASDYHRRRDSIDIDQEEAEQRARDSVESESDEYDSELNRFYEKAVKEIENESTDEKVWALAFASTDTLDETQHRYVKLRAKSLHESSVESKTRAEQKERTLLERKLIVEEISFKKKEIERLQNGLFEHEINLARAKEHFRNNLIIIGLCVAGFIFFPIPIVSVFVLFTVLLCMLYFGALSFKLLRIGITIKPSVNSIKILREEVKELTSR